MSLAATASIALLGLEGHPVTIEVDIGDGLPGYTLLGLPDAALAESKERIRSAIVNSQLQWPNRKVTVSLSPAWLPKRGSSFDLGIATGILVADGVIPDTSVAGSLIFGELGLSGEVRSVPGILPALIAARSQGFNRAIVPMANASEAMLVEGVTVYPVSSLPSLIALLRDGVTEESDRPKRASEAEPTFLDLADVAGQSRARFALEVAAVGGHHLLMIGPPGTGKTMLAQRLPSILPPLPFSEALEVAAIHSVAGKLHSASHLPSEPPFVAPHHATTAIAMVGGGSHLIRPGACSLAHRGVLFIDEAPECSSGVLDSLRQPLESGSVTITRAVGTVAYPANFMLVLAANPCPCGKYFGKGRGCTCSSLQIRRYLQRLSGPLLDRIDIRTIVDAPSRTELFSNVANEPSALVRQRVVQARERSNRRFAGHQWKRNNEIPAKFLAKEFSAEPKGMAFLHAELDQERLSARGLHKVLRVAWSIADLRGVDVPTREDVELAFSMRESVGQLP